MPPPFFSTSVGTSTSVVVTCSVGVSDCVPGIGRRRLGRRHLLRPGRHSSTKKSHQCHAEPRKDPNFMPEIAPLSIIGDQRPLSRALRGVARLPCTGKMDSDHGLSIRSRLLARSSHRGASRGTRMPA